MQTRKRVGLEMKGIAPNELEFCTEGARRGLKGAQRKLGKNSVTDGKRPVPERRGPVRRMKGLCKKQAPPGGWPGSA